MLLKIIYKYKYNPLKILNIYNERRKRVHFESENSENDENMDIEIEEPIDDQNKENNDSEEDIEEEELFLSNIHFKYNEEEFT